MNYRQENRIPWLFTDFDNIKDFPWLFPDLEKFSFFPDFSLTVATLSEEMSEHHLLSTSPIQDLNDSPRRTIIFHLGTVHTNPNTFKTASFWHQLTVRPEETS